MIWRIFRLPGSRENWHIDAGCVHHAFNVRAWEIHVNSRAVDVGGNNVPRAWIEIRDADLHIINGVAVFDPPNFSCPIQKVLADAGACVGPDGEITLPQPPDLTHPERCQ